LGEIVEESVEGTPATPTAFDYAAAGALLVRSQAESLFAVETGTSSIAAGTVRPTTFTLLRKAVIKGAITARLTPAIIDTSRTRAFLITIKAERTITLTAFSFRVTGLAIWPTFFALLRELLIVCAPGTGSTLSSIYLATAATLLVVLEEEGFIASVACRLICAVVAEGAAVFTGIVSHEFAGTAGADFGLSADSGAFGALASAASISDESIRALCAAIPVDTFVAVFTAIAARATLVVGGTCTADTLIGAVEDEGRFTPFALSLTCASFTPFTTLVAFFVNLIKIAVSRAPLALLILQFVLVLAFKARLPIDALSAILSTEGAFAGNLTQIHTLLTVNFVAGTFLPLKS